MEAIPIDGRAVSPRPRRRGGTVGLADIVSGGDQRSTTCATVRGNVSGCDAAGHHVTVSIRGVKRGPAARDGEARNCRTHHANATNMGLRYGLMLLMNPFTHTDTGRPVYVRVRFRIGTVMCVHVAYVHVQP